MSSGGGKTQASYLHVSCNFRRVKFLFDAKIMTAFPCRNASYHQLGTNSYVNIVIIRKVNHSAETACCFTINSPQAGELYLVKVLYTYFRVALYKH